MILKKRQTGIRDISLHQPKRLVLEGDMTRDSCFKSGYTLCPQTDYLSTHLHELGRGVITENSNLGHGNMA